MAPIKIAFYGKGGIGKSTVSANISASLALMGKKVLHIGCDPKSDSTRLITEKKIPTVLNQIISLSDNLRREDIVFTGSFGISCIEAGGPQAGIGCAGMGITAMEEELKRIGIFDEDWDVIIYDVLGDVVCGGFAVPMRKHYVDKVFVVASSDFMALYAANNILRGICSCSGEGEKLCGGLILNHSRDNTDIEIASEFAERTGISPVKIISESREIKLSDYKKQTLVGLFPNSPVSEQFKKLSELILSDPEGVRPVPMSDEELDDFCESMFAVRNHHEGL